VRTFRANIRSWSNQLNDYLLCSAPMLLVSGHFTATFSYTWKRACFVWFTSSPNE
jgi:hypothetical protein